MTRVLLPMLGLLGASSGCTPETGLTLDTSIPDDVFVEPQESNYPQSIQNCLSMIDPNFCPTDENEEECIQYILDRRGEFREMIVDTFDDVDRFGDLFTNEVPVTFNYWYSNGNNTFTDDNGLTHRVNFSRSYFTFGDYRTEYEDIFSLDNPYNVLFGDRFEEHQVPYLNCQTQVAEIGDGTVEKNLRLTFYPNGATEEDFGIDLIIKFGGDLQNPGDHRAAFYVWGRFDPLEGRGHMLSEYLNDEYSASLDINDYAQAFYETDYRSDLLFRSVADFFDLSVDDETEILISPSEQGYFHDGTSE